jgi:tetratricopeptide (TPR) repeat protein
MPPRTQLLPLALPLLLLAACRATPSARALPPGAQAVSLSGEPLYPPPMSPEDLAKREADLAEARAALERSPDDATAIVWYGRRLAYLGFFNEAIEAYTRGLEKHPDDARLWRHRGHRYVNVRRFDEARADLERAVELVRGKPDEPEPGAVPNARGVVIDTLQQNVWYHLALVHYLGGEFERALPAWAECAARSKNDDALCSVTHWRYMTLRRLGRHEEAKRTLEKLPAKLDVIEYHAYHSLIRMYRGEIKPETLLAEARAKDPASSDFATLGYGIANYWLCNGDAEKARALFADVARAPLWAAFGRIAAEVELARGASS